MTQFDLEELKLIRAAATTAPHPLWSSIHQKASLLIAEEVCRPPTLTKPEGEVQ